MFGIKLGHMRSFLLVDFTNVFSVNFRMANVSTEARPCKTQECLHEAESHSATEHEIMYFIAVGSGSAQLLPNLLPAVALRYGRLSPMRGWLELKQKQRQSLHFVFIWFRLEEL